MDLHPTIDAALVLVLLLDLTLLAVGRLHTCIRIFAIQCLILAFLPLAAEQVRGEGIGHEALILLLGTLGLKVWLIPWLLRRTIDTGEIHREIEPLIGFTASVVIGAMMIAGCFAVASHLRLPQEAAVKPLSALLVPASLSTLLIGLLILVSRTKAITQVIGYLVVENGIFLFGLTLLRQMPLMVELGILLDVFVGVFVMAIVVYHIRREFDHMDTHALDQLKES
jgi:hydrogenase-4 component E